MNSVSKLMYKDLITLKSFKKLVLVFGIFILGLPLLDSAAITLIPFYLSFVLSFQVIGYEEKYNGRYLTGYLPVKRDHVVMAKYMEGLLLTLIGTIIMILLYVVLNSIARWNSELNLMAVFLIGGLFSMVGNAIFLPLYMIIGMNRARIVLTLLVIAFIIVPINLIQTTDIVQVVNFIQLNKELLMFGGIIIALIIYALSYLICAYILNNKDI